MKFKNRETGRRAESLACKSLIDKDYQILETNFSNKYGEVDIIAKDKDILVFVEVKGKKGTDFGLPEEMINPGKLRKIKNMATVYTKGESVLCRIDVIAVVLSPDDNLVRLTHYENVYM